VKASKSMVKLRMTMRLKMGNKIFMRIIRRKTNNNKNIMKIRRKSRSIMISNNRMKISNHNKVSPHYHL